jgi:hypothetical protein
MNPKILELLAIVQSDIRVDDFLNCFRHGGFSREKAGGRYTVGFSLRLPARFSGAIASRADCNGTVNKRLIALGVRCERDPKKSRPCGEQRTGRVDENYDGYPAVKADRYYLKPRIGSVQK